MNFADYQQQAATTAVYPRAVGDFGLAYCALKLNGEVAELGDKLDALAAAPSDDALRDGARKEAGDVYWYIANLALEARVAVGADTSPRPFAGPADCAVFLSRAAGAIGEVVGKVYRDHGGAPTPAQQASLAASLEDLLAALAWLVTSALGSTVEEIWAANVAKLRSRQQRGVLHGSGDER
jgi:NTP pyrophosphatase (non-canonical NTP hydrolase)